MKKLLIVAAAVATAGICCASTIKWNVNNIYTCDATGKGSTATKAAAGDYYVMCFLASNLSLSDALTALEKGNVSTLAGKATYKGVTTATGVYASQKYDGGYVADDKVDLYAVVFNAKTAESATYATISDAVTSFTFTDSAQDKTLAVSMKTPTQNEWTAMAVPEPFSGTLALLGMGAIALRRKMKKAKKA